MIKHITAERQFYLSYHSSEERDEVMGVSQVHKALEGLVLRAKSNEHRREVSHALVTLSVIQCADDYLNVAHIGPVTDECH